MRYEACRGFLTILSPLPVQDNSLQRPSIDTPCVELYGWHHECPPLCLFEDSLLDLPQRASWASPASLATPSLLLVTDTDHGAPSWPAVVKQGLSLVLGTISPAETHLYSGKDTPLMFKPGELVWTVVMNCVARLPHTSALMVRSD